MHPSGGRRTELIWEGKYDASGKRVAPLRVQLPFQTVEMVNESAQERQKALSLFESPGAYLAKAWRNRLIWGDKKYVLPALLTEFAGKVNLIYIDPPFDTGADFSFTATVPDHPNGPKTIPSRLPSSQVSSNKKLIATHGGAASIPICNGSTRPLLCCTSYLMKTAAYLFISTGT